MTKPTKKLIETKEKSLLFSKRNSQTLKIMESVYVHKYLRNLYKPLIGKLNRHKKLSAEKENTFQKNHQILKIFQNFFKKNLKGRLNRRKNILKQNNYPCFLPKNSKHSKFLKNV